jgi:acyl-CoA reductase-like NAD-dependent aldehyde dehydrogenase
VIGKDLLSLIALLRSLASNGKPQQIKKRRAVENGNGTTAVEVFPYASGDTMGPDADWKVEVWVDGAEVKQRVPPTEGRLCLLLGAGNQTVLAFVDALHILFVESMTCVVKHNPVREFNHKWMLKVFEPLIRRGYFASTVGGIEESKALLADERINHVHMTGGKATHDMIVWGHPTQRDRKVLQVPITSELGAVTPCIFGPSYGDSAWRKEEIEHHAMYFATCLMSNNGCNCMAYQVLFLPAEALGFPVEQFLAAVKAVMKERPHSAPYYPGTRDRHKAWCDHFGGGATELVESDVQLPPGRHGPPLPWALSRVSYADLVAGKHPEACQTEVFGPALAVCVVESESEAAYWAQVTEAANDHLFGSLSCTVVPHPSMHESAVSQVVRGLRFGSVGVNAWGGQAFGYPGGSWGAFPGEALEAVQSGRGHVHNHLLLEGVQKTVTYAPFRSAHHVGSGLQSPPTLKYAKFLASVIFTSAPAWRQFVHTAKWLLSWAAGQAPTVVKEKRAPEED